VDGPELAARHLAGMADVVQLCAIAHARR
jgi:hypothetical protein